MGDRFVGGEVAVLTEVVDGHHPGVVPDRDRLAADDRLGEILRIDDQTTVHNSNDLAFGPDGYLYIATGDDDLDDDASLSRATTDGTILRIDVDDASGNGRYTIPVDNPYVGNPAGYIEEIFAWGFRNPWRIAFHPDTGDLLVADIGEDDIEEESGIVEER